MRRSIVVCAFLLAACSKPAVQRPVTVGDTTGCVRVNPVPLAVYPEGLATAQTPKQLVLSEAIVDEVQRSGIIRTMYVVNVCQGAVGEVQKSTRFADLDQFLDAQIGSMGLVSPSDGCTTATLILTFTNACELQTFG